MKKDKEKRRCKDLLIFIFAPPFRSGYVNFSLVRFLGLHIEWNIDTQGEICIAT